MAKRALLVGCNYPGTEAELRGCVNDVFSMQSLLVECFGFENELITIMIDTDENTPTPTGANIKRALLDHVTACQPGDVLVFHFSGHGTQIPDDSEERDGKDEALYPADGNVITDDDLRDIVAQLPEGVKFTMISDCCHSGSMLDHPEQQISGEKTESEAEPVSDFGNRSIEPDMFMQLLGAKAGLQIGRGNIRSTMRDLFGDDASNKAKSWTGFLEMFMQDESVQPPYIPGNKPENLLDAEKGILITGCQASETSADATINDVPCGALTNAITSVVRTLKEQDPEAQITYVDLVRNVRAHLLQGGFAQNPCLECSDNNANATFIV